MNQMRYQGLREDITQTKRTNVKVKNHSVWHVQKSAKNLKSSRKEIQKRS